MLKIVIYEGIPGYYLIRFAADETELTDTFHDSIQSAISQASWEIAGPPIEWETVGSTH